MSELKATPGPWRIGRWGNCIISDSSDGIEIDGATGDEAARYYGGNMIAESVSPNNAYLIAAAPDMYELLQEIAYEECGERECDAVWLRARIDELLAKARGESGGQDE